MRPYPDIPIWMRPTDWDLLPGESAYEKHDLELLKVMRDRGCTFVEISKIMGMNPNNVGRLYRKYVEGECT